MYKRVSKAYAKKYNQEFDVDYNKMIKQTIKYNIVDDLREVFTF